MQQLTAPAKLTLSLRVTGVRADGYHLLDAEMVTVDLADTLEISDGSGLEVVDDVVGGLGTAGLGVGPDNLVRQALGAVERHAAVRLVKRIPVGAGLGGGSADAAAVLRWAGCRDFRVAASLGADVPFCVVGGRARVRGVGDAVEPLAFAPCSFLLVLPPLSVDTAAVYRAWDAGHRPTPATELGNDLEPAAMAVAPGLAVWRDALAEMSGARPRLAGSGAAWFVEAGQGWRPDVGDSLVVGGRRGAVLWVHALDVPASATSAADRGVPDAPLPPKGAGVRES
jgi:4-diphosphocytidyl-2-C-methyl-D-erythritol kinase